MNCREVMDILSQCGTGAVLLRKDGRILQMNSAAMRLLHADFNAIGTNIRETAPGLEQEDGEPQYCNIAFGEYLKRCPAPEVSDLTGEERLLAFCDASAEASRDMLLNTLNQMTEQVTIYDEKGRLYLLNNAAMKMESIVQEDVLGDRVGDIYECTDEEYELTAPEVLETRKAILDRRQHYVSRYGKTMDVVTNSYPLVQDGQLLGAVCVMEDWTTAERLQKQVVDLQSQLMELSAQPRGSARRTITAKYDFNDIIYSSAAMRGVIETCRRVAKTDASVMLYGETGTGKELFAQSIHNASERANGPFLAINCAAIPENLLESTLFGTEKGAYTGAERRAGLLEQASYGTLLLDELNSMNMSLQAKLLRVLQEGVVRRVGGSTEIRVDVRVLTNINIPPRQAIEEKKLRQDLFYRLGVVNVNIPPLRERKEDIPLLVRNFIMRNNRKLSRNVQDIDREALELLQRYEWPGNVRELQHAIEQAMIVLPDTESVIYSRHIPEHIAAKLNLPERPEYTPAAAGKAGPAEPPRSAPERTGLPEGSLNRYVKNLERETLCRLLAENGGNVTHTARQLGMSRQNLQYHIKRHGIDIRQLKGAAGSGK